MDELEDTKKALETAHLICSKATVSHTELQVEVPTLFQCIKYERVVASVCVCTQLSLHKIICTCTCTFVYTCMSFVLSSTQVPYCFSGCSEMGGAYSL